MPFLAPIGAAIAGAVGAAGAVAAGVVAAVGPVVSGIATAVGLAGTIYSAVNGNIGGAVAGAVATGSLIAGGSVSGIINALKPAGSAAQAAGGLAAVFGTNTLNEISGLFTNVIDPISKDISSTYNLVSGTVNQINTLAHSGIQGILAIPSAVAGAVGGIDQTFSRFGTVLGNQNATIAHDTLVPGITKAVADPIASLQGSLEHHFTSDYVGLTEPPEVKLTTAFDTTAAHQKYLEFLLGTKKAKGLVGTLINWLGEFFAVAPFAEALNGQSESIMRQGLNIANPKEPLPLGAIVDADWRNQIPYSEAVAEAARSGIDPTRYATLHNLKAWLPGIGEGLRMLFRGSITQPDLEQALKRQGLSETDIQSLIAAFSEPVNPREAIAANGRFAMAEKGFLPESYGSKIPQEYLALYGPRFADPKIGAFDWIEHWRTPGMSWWITAYFRGLVTEAEVLQAAQAENIPGEVVPKLIQVEQEVTQLWMIPDMLATGILNEAEARSYLFYIGLAPRDTDIIITYGLAKAKAPAAAQASQLAAISAGNAKTMFEDGIINDSTYAEILQLHNYTPEAAALTVDLAKQEIDLTSRTNAANLIVTQIELGVLTQTAAQGQLYALGYTTAEVQKYITQAQLALVKKTKVPTETELKAFWKHGIITDAELTTGLEADGWSPTYARAFLALYKAGG